MSRPSATNLEAAPSVGASGHSIVSKTGGNPAVPTRVLNPYQMGYEQHARGSTLGLLNPNQLKDYGRYFTIGSAYSNSCSLSSPYYTVRSNGVIRK